jgi:fatty acid desaturase
LEAGLLASPNVNRTTSLITNLVMVMVMVMAVVIMTVMVVVVMMVLVVVMVMVIPGGLVPDLLENVHHQRRLLGHHRADLLLEERLNCEDCG